MKNNKLLLISVLVLFALASCDNSNSKKLPSDLVNNSQSANKNNTNNSPPKMFFKETMHDFGDIIYGEKVIYGFEFTNIGGADLIITRVNSSCGCTVGDYPKQPIKPGKNGVISVAFDSKGRKGIQNKSVTILANTEPNKTTLRIKGRIIEPERQ